jgi:hypothetical protein
LIVEYVKLPAGNQSYSRPMINVQLTGLDEAPLACLVDSGAVYNKFHSDFAEAAGINLEEPDEVHRFDSGGRSYSGRVVRVRLKIASFEWEAPVCFVDDWDQDFQILGHEGFFRWFKVCFHAVDEQLSLEQVNH